MDYSFQKRPTRELWKLATVCLLPMLVVLTLTIRDQADSSTSSFDDELLRRTKQSSAQIVFIGNSMLDTRIDKVAWRKISAPNSSHFLTIPGSRTLAYYCLLKNFASHMKAPPKLVILFYRNYDFHRLDDHIDGIHLTRLRNVMLPEDEPLLNQARGGGRGKGLWKDSFVEQWFPEKSAVKMRKRVKELTYDIAALGSSQGDDALAEEVLQAFEMKNFRLDAAEDGAATEQGLGESPYAFEVTSKNSLLPEFLALSKSLGAKLCFYRVKKRPNESNETPQDKYVREYTAAFKAWAEANGCLHVDETEDPSLTLDMYRDGDHLAPESKAEYGEIFLERMKAHLPRPLKP